MALSVQRWDQKADKAAEDRRKQNSRPYSQCSLRELSIQNLFCKDMLSLRRLVSEVDSAWRKSEAGKKGLVAGQVGVATVQLTGSHRRSTGGLCDAEPDYCDGAYFYCYRVIYFRLQLHRLRWQRRIMDRLRRPRTRNDTRGRVPEILPNVTEINSFVHILKIEMLWGIHQHVVDTLNFSLHTESFLYLYTHTS
jgi:hypothetical protein